MVTGARSPGGTVVASVHADLRNSVAGPRASHNLDYFIREMDRASNRLSFAIVIAAIVIGSAVVVHAGIGPHALGYASLGLAGFVAAGILGIGLAVGILRSGRL